MNRENIKHFLQELVSLIDYFNEDLETNKVKEKKLINYHNKSQFDDLLPREGGGGGGNPMFRCGFTASMIANINDPDLTNYENTLSEGDKEKGKVTQSHAKEYNKFTKIKASYNQAINANPANENTVNSVRKALYKAQKQLLNSNCVKNYFKKLKECKKTTQSCRDQAAKWRNDTDNGLTFSAGKGDGYTFKDTKDTAAKYYQDLINTAVYLDSKACECRINAKNMKNLKEARIEITDEAEDDLGSSDTATFVHEVRTGNAYGTGVKQNWSEYSCTIS